MTTPVATARSALLDLARRAIDEGAYDRVADLYRAACRDGVSAPEARTWRGLLLEAGDFDGARDAECRGGGPAEPALDEPRAEPLPGEEDDDFLDFEPGDREVDQAAGPSPLVATFLRHFAGRADVHARQWHDARQDRTGYWPVREPLTERVAADHLLRRQTIGQYVLHPDHTVSFAALDLDPTAEALEHLRLGGDVGPLGLPALVDYARRLLEAARRAGLPLVAEDTGGVGLHLWLLFAPRVPAPCARALLREILWRAGAQPPGVSVEVFPKQERLTGKGLGSVVVDPLVVACVNRRSFTQEDFEGGGEGDPVHFKRSAMRWFVELFERRVRQEIVYPPRGQRLTYRQVIEEQARHFARVLLGSDEGYSPFVVR
jgi:hypothetical protein